MRKWALTTDNFSGSCAIKELRNGIVPGGRYEVKGFLFFKGSTRTRLTAHGNDSGGREKLIVKGREVNCRRKVLGKDEDMES